MWDMLSQQSSTWHMSHYRRHDSPCGVNLLLLITTYLGYNIKVCLFFLLMHISQFHQFAQTISLYFLESLFNRCFHAFIELYFQVSWHQSSRHPLVFLVWAFLWNICFLRHFIKIWKTKIWKIWTKCILGQWQLITMQLIVNATCSPFLLSGQYRTAY